MNTSEPPKGCSPHSGKYDDDAATPTVDAVIQSKIGQKLRESYQQVVNEAVPPRFLDLLDQLKKKERPCAEDGS